MFDMMKYIVLILTMVTRLAVGKGEEACNGTIKNVEMKQWNLTVWSFNFNHNLKWLPPPVAVSKVKFHVSIKCNVCDQWQLVPGCEDVSKTHCDLTRHMSDSILTYAIRVEVVEACISGTKTWNFRPNEDTILGPPNITILNDLVTFRQPRDPNGTRVGYHYSDMSYLVRQSGNTEDDPCNTPEDMIIVKDSFWFQLLQGGEGSSNCFSVRLYSRSYEKCGRWSKPYCQPVSLPRHRIVGLCTTVVITSFLLLAIGVHLISNFVWKPKYSLPHCLTRWNEEVILPLSVISNTCKISKLSLTGEVQDPPVKKTSATSSMSSGRGTTLDDRTSVAAELLLGQDMGEEGHGELADDVEEEDVEGRFSTDEVNERTTNEETVASLLLVGGVGEEGFTIPEPSFLGYGKVRVGDSPAIPNSGIEQGSHLNLTTDVSGTTGLLKEANHIGYSVSHSGHVISR
uniref:uncharacterized protein isoform X1 n=2 Tax=Myxine glutinosa TaxID=7769 RepID=UPI00358E2514